MEIRRWLLEATTILSAGESPKRDAEILLAYVTGKSRSWLIAFDDTRLTPNQLLRLDGLIARRARGEPVALLTGQREFWSLPLRVSAATLIPRPDSETLVMQALSRLPPSSVEILDLGTGCGALALALATERPDCRLTGVDRVEAAVCLAQQNAQNLRVGNVHFLFSDWFSALQSQTFTMIVCNPPYIAASDPHLRQGDVRFEPRSALISDQQGLGDIKRIAAQAGRYLLPGGWLLFEHGWQQAASVRDILAEQHFSRIFTCQDFAGNDRVTGATA